jgi:tetratricopeptide (TPR) repeat protein
VAVEPRALALVLPTAAVLAALVAHSLAALPRRRALAFWAAAAVYGVARGLVLELVVEGGLGASLPYRIHQPLWPVAGVPLQEVAGWAVVAYLGWWLGDRFAAAHGRPRHALFVTLAWACLFLGAVAWAVEAAAVAAGWWHWTVPVSRPLFANVPFIGLVDWFFVGTDLVLPFLALTAPALRRARWRWATLLAFPLHFAAHLGVERPAQWLPVPPYHVMHAALLAGLLWAAARSRRADPAFVVPAGLVRHLPVAALAVIVADVALVEAWLAGRPGLLPSLLPVAAVAVQALRPAWGYALALAGLLGIPAHPSLALAAVPAATSLLLRRLQGSRRRVLALAVAALCAVVWLAHWRGAAAERDLVARLAHALAARDRGEVGAAEGELRAAAAAHPGAHAPAALLAELYYRTGRHRQAAEAAERVLAVRQDHLPAHRLRAVVALLAGEREAAAEAARRGLAVAPGDPELGYLERRARGADLAAWRGFEALAPRTAQGVVALAWEVGDRSGSAHLLDRALARWPGHRWFYPTRVKVALAAGDEEAARRALAAWRHRFPGDPEAARVPLP